MRSRCLLVLVATLILPAVPAAAAPDAGAKARGQYDFYGHSAHHGFTSARSHVETYQRYLVDTHDVAAPAAGAAIADPAAQIAAHGAVDPDVAREASDAIAGDISRIQRHVNRMRSLATERGDATALATLADVDKQLAVARRSHAALHEHHAADAIAPVTAMRLAQQVNDALRAAHAEHDEVVRRLGDPAPAR